MSEIALLWADPGGYETCPRVVAAFASPDQAQSVADRLKAAQADALARWPDPDSDLSAEAWCDEHDRVQAHRKRRVARAGDPGYAASDDETVWSVQRVTLREGAK